ncbi:hypothetical protein SUGI_0338280 [Cryptomeria japonica]|nr:hypothetical protein SUGI_0338280 [Cryptomeria japonica]
MSRAATSSSMWQQWSRHMAVVEGKVTGEETDRGATNRSDEQRLRQAKNMSRESQGRAESRPRARDRRACGGRQDWG